MTDTQIVAASLAAIAVVVGLAYLSVRRAGRRKPGHEPRRRR